MADRVLLEANGGRWAAVTPGVESPPGVARLSGLTVPGLANAHSHAFHRALRGRTHDGEGDFWTWREAMYAVAARLDPDSYLALARAVYAEMALAGITTVGEFHYLHHGRGGRPYDDANAMGRALAEAAAAAGVRLTLLDACYLRGGFDRPLEGAQLRFGDGDAEAWAQRADALVDAPGLRVGAAIHSVRAVDPQAAATVAAWAGQRDAPLHAHVSEQPVEDAAALTATGRTPTALLAEAGALGPRFTAVHATHCSPADLATLATGGSAVCLCPTTERDLADGVGPNPDRLCLGSDSHAVIDLFEEARAVELDTRLVTGRRGHHAPAALLDAATTTGAAALGWDVALRPGALADFATVDLSSVRTAGTDPAQVVFSATAADVTTVVVGGREIVTDRHHATIPDVPTALQSAISAVLG